MLREDFGSASPGELVRTSFEEHGLENGQPVTLITDGWAFVPDPLPPTGLALKELLGELYGELITAERSLARLDGIGEDLLNASLLWAPLAHREAILSSRIEDTIASAEELASIEAGEKPERREALEVSNYVKALNHGLRSDLPVCCRLMREMHSVLLSRGVRGSDARPGEFRIDQNYIGNQEDGFTDARFVPPPAGTHLTSGLDSFEKYANQNSYGLPKLVAIALMHYQFETIHPFRDGNGRIGRLIAALSLCKMNLLREPFVYLSGYFEPRREQYNDLMLRVSTSGRWLPWIRFFLNAIAMQSADAANRIRKLRKTTSRIPTQTRGRQRARESYGTC